MVSRHEERLLPLRASSGQDCHSSPTGSPAGSDKGPQTSDSGSYTTGAIHTGDSDVSFQSTIGVGDLTLPLAASCPETEALLSPGASDSTQDRTTLATLRNEALVEYSHNQAGNKSTGTVGVGDPPPKRPRMNKPDKVFKETYFCKIGWSRVFVIGPMNPLENPHCFFCRICQRDVSIYWKGAAEVECMSISTSHEHFRRDQKWRYTHLRCTDPITGCFRSQIPSFSPVSLSFSVKKLCSYSATAKFPLLRYL